MKINAIFAFLTLSLGACAHGVSTTPRSGPPTSGVAGTDKFWGIQDGVELFTASTGYLYQPLPSEGGVDLPQFNFGYQKVDQGLLQAGVLSISLSDTDQVIDFIYKIGFGPYEGFWHIGGQVGVGFAHLYDERQGHIVGFHYRIGPMIDFTLPWWLPPTIRFHISGGWAGMPASTGEYRDPVDWQGGTFEVGVSFKF